jgi:hypothetical protein
VERFSVFIFCRKQASRLRDAIHLNCSACTRDSDCRYLPTRADRFFSVQYTAGKDGFLRMKNKLNIF